MVGIVNSILIIVVVCAAFGLVFLGLRRLELDRKLYRKYGFPIRARDCSEEDKNLLRERTRLSVYFFGLVLTIAVCLAAMVR